MPVNIYSNLPGDDINAEELKLYNLINQYRNQNNLPSITASKALSTVANRHVWDLAENIGSLTHGWSDAPYDSNNSSTYSSMWTAPQRFNTGYLDNGYENAFGGSGNYVATAEDAFNAWKNSSGHNAVILNLNVWQNYPWNALGLAIYKGYAVMWVGEESDPTGEPLGLPIDTLQYAASYADLLVAFGNDAGSLNQHYNTSGYYEGRSKDIFDEFRYIASNHDLIRAFGANGNAATQHYINHGYHEGRSKDSFSADQYLASHDDLLNAFGNDYGLATQHYINHGYAEGRSPNVFSPAQYLASHDDLLNAFGNDYGLATQHYINHGYYEGRSKDSFSEDTYIASNHDLIIAFGYNLGGATAHYINHGWSEQRTIDSFDAAAYLGAYSDLKSAFGNDLGLATKHYIEYGYFEGRSDFLIEMTWGGE